MRSALSEFIVEGVPTTVSFHRQIFAHPDFVAGNYDINFLESTFKKVSVDAEQVRTGVTLKRPAETDQAAVATATRPQVKEAAQETDEATTRTEK